MQRFIHMYVCTYVQTQACLRVHVGRIWRFLCGCHSDCSCGSVKFVVCRYLVDLLAASLAIAIVVYVYVGISSKFCKTSKRLEMLHVCVFDDGLAAFSRTHSNYSVQL